MFFPVSVVIPAININKSGTRREDLLTSEDELKKMWILRKILHPMDEIVVDNQTNVEILEMQHKYLELNYKRTLGP